MTLITRITDWLAALPVWIWQWGSLALVVAALFVIWSGRVRSIKWQLALISAFCLVLWGLFWFSKIDPRIWQAIIGGAFLALGWIYNGWRNRQDARELRDEKLRDTHKAIFAEIATHLASLSDEDTLDAHANALVAKMASDPNFVPFIPKEHKPRIFHAMDQDIYILPRVTIDWIVMYYSQIDAVAALAEDMRGTSFRLLPQDRRIAMYLDYVEMRKQALEFGRICNHLIEIFAENGKDAADLQSKRYTASLTDPKLNTRTEDRSAT